MLTLPSFLIATQRLGQNRVKALMPGGRMYVDTRSSHSYFRPSPDGERILWGGRASLTPLVEATATDRLRRHMSSVFPELADTGIDDSWTGRIAYSRDGVAQIAGTDEAASPFDVTRLRGWPPSSLMPLGIRAFELWHRYKDRREGVLAPIAYR
jgi:glycine/D-amino acid oxidase-like deaminating enzyme